MSHLLAVIHIRLPFGLHQLLVRALPRRPILGEAARYEQQNDTLQLVFGIGACGLRFLAIVALAVHAHLRRSIGILLCLASATGDKNAAPNEKKKKSWQSKIIRNICSIYLNFSSFARGVRTRKRMTPKQTYAAQMQQSRSHERRRRRDNNLNNKLTWSAVCRARFHMNTPHHVADKFGQIAPHYIE